MRITEEDIELEWAVWGDSKPWWCPKCKSFLASDFFTECDGTDAALPKADWNPHEKIKASDPVSKEEFAKHMLEQYGQHGLEVVDVGQEDKVAEDAE